MKRLSLLTVIILGDGIIVMAQNVVTIVEGPDAWSAYMNLGSYGSRLTQRQIPIRLESSQQQRPPSTSSSSPISTG